MHSGIAPGVFKGRSKQSDYPSRLIGHYQTWEWYNDSNRCDSDVAVTVAVIVAVIVGVALTSPVLV